ncbi:MAG TPA: ATP-binding protein [Herbaspirillum sp.]|nr:ATP-binding protein [Herbaspirillum sp.]
MSVLSHKLETFLSNAKWLHSLRRQLALVLALLAILVAAYGVTAIYALNQSRSATRELAEQQLVRLQASHDLIWQILSAASLADTLAKTNSSEEAGLRYADLSVQLKKIEGLVVQLSGGDNDLNVLDLQYSNQLFSATASAVVQQRGMLLAAHRDFELAYRHSYEIFNSNQAGANVNARLIMEVLQTSTNASAVRQLRTTLGNLPHINLPWTNDADDPFVLRLNELDRQATIDLLQNALHQHELNIMASAREQSDYFARDYRNAVLALAVAIKRRQEWVIALLSVSLLLLWLIAYKFIGLHVLGRMRLVSQYLRFDRLHASGESRLQVPVEGSDEIAAMARALERFLEDREQLQLARKLLEESQVHLRTIIEHAADSFVILQQGLISHLNPAATRLLGWQLGESPRLDMASIISHTGAAHQVDTIATAQDGRAIPVEVSVSEVARIEGQTVILVIRDATMRREAERQLTCAKDAAEAARSAQAAFLSNMSHEFRTPLNAILGYTQILERDPHMSSLCRRGIEIIDQSGQHLLALVNDILDLAQIEANRMELHACQFDLANFMRVIADIAVVKIEQKGLAFRREWAANLPMIVGDEKRLRQVLLNLIGNAVKFTHNGFIRLHVQWQANNGQSGVLRFEIEDSGVGIAAADLPHVFERFTQVGDRQARAGGTGLGLAICGQLLPLMGSHLQVRSRVGEGSVFWFDLPLAFGVASTDAAIAPASPMALPQSFAAVDMRINNMIDPAAIAAPPAEDLSALLALARIGDLTQIGHYAATLIERDVQYRAFADPLIKMAADLRSKAALQYLKQFIEREFS